MHFTFMEMSTTFHTVNLLRTMKTGTVQDVSEILRLLFTLYSVQIKSFWFLAKLRKVFEIKETLKVFKDFSSFGRNDSRPSLETNLKNVIKITKIYYASAILTCIVSAVFPLFEYEKRRLPYETWLPWDYKNNDALFWVSTFHQYFMSLYGATLNCTFDILLVIFLRYISTMIEELSVDIESISRSGNRDALKQLEKCSEYHIRIKQLAAEVSTELTFAFFLQTFLSTVILCTSAYMLTSVSFIIVVSRVFHDFFVQDFAFRSGANVPEHYKL